MDQQVALTKTLDCVKRDMKSLVIKGWAVYTCMNGESVTGKALLFRTLPFDARVGPFCG